MPVLGREGAPNRLRCRIRQLLRVHRMLQTATHWLVSRHALQRCTPGPCGCLTQAWQVGPHRTHDLTDHDHTHGDGCGHRAVPHDEHLDYLHDGHWHAAHDGHYDQHLNINH